MLMPLKQKIIYNTAVQFAGRFFTSLIGFLTTLILARWLGAENYGIYAKVYTLAAFFYLFVDFGLNAIYIRKYQAKTNSLAQVFLLRSFFFLISLLIIALFFVFSGESVFSLQEKLLAFLFFPTVLFFGYFCTLNIIFQIKLRYDLSVLAAGLGSTGGLILILAAVKFGLPWVILGLVGGYFFTTLFAFFFARRLALVPVKLFLPQLSFSFLKLLSEAWPLGTVLFLNSVYARADIFVLSALKGNEAVGIYSLAYKFFEFPLSLAAFFANSIFPHYVKTYAQNKARFFALFKKATLGLLLLAVVFSVFGFLLAPLLGLVKPEYRASAAPLRILVLSFPVFFATSALSWLAIIKKQEKFLLFIYGLAFLLNISANYFLVPQYGYLASSWITVAGESFVLGALLFIAPYKS
jgi:O-antigen/teichoic acid export membrane protein